VSSRHPPTSSLVTNTSPIVLFTLIRSQLKIRVPSLALSVPHNYIGTGTSRHRLTPQALCISQTLRPCSQVTQRCVPKRHTSACSTFSLIGKHSDGVGSIRTANRRYEAHTRSLSLVATTRTQYGNRCKRNHNGHTLLT
jgi:hypothetical protein